MSMSHAQWLMCIVRISWNCMHIYAAAERLFGFSRQRQEWWTNRTLADEQKDRQSERGDDQALQCEIVKWLMEEGAQSLRQIIRQEAKAELLAEDHTQTCSMSIYHVCLRNQMLSCLPFIQACLTACPAPATHCVCFLSEVYVSLVWLFSLCCQSLIRFCSFRGNALLLLIWVKPQYECTPDQTRCQIISKPSFCSHGPMKCEHGHVESIIMKTKTHLNASSRTHIPTQTHFLHKSFHAIQHSSWISTAQT